MFVFPFVFQLSVRLCVCEIVHIGNRDCEMRQRRCLRRSVLEERLAQICLVRRSAKVVVCLIHIVKLQFALGMRKSGVCIRSGLAIMRFDFFREALALRSSTSSLEM